MFMIDDEDGGGDGDGTMTTTTTTTTVAARGGGGLVQQRRFSRYLVERNTLTPSDHSASRGDNAWLSRRKSRDHACPRPRSILGIHDRYTHVYTYVVCTYVQHDGRGSERESADRAVDRMRHGKSHRAVPPRGRPGAFTKKLDPLKIHTRILYLRSSRIHL